MRSKYSPLISSVPKLSHEEIRLLLELEFIARTKCMKALRGPLSRLDQLRQIEQECF